MRQYTFRWKKERFTLCVPWKAIQLSNINFMWRELESWRERERVSAMKRKKIFSIHFNYMKFEQSRSATCIIILAFEIVFSIFSSFELLLLLLPLPTVLRRIFGTLQWLWVYVCFLFFSFLFLFLAKASCWFNQSTRMPAQEERASERVRETYILIAKL